jgi:hypothetical protein
MACGRPGWRTEQVGSRESAHQALAAPLQEHQVVVLRNVNEEHVDA